MLLSRLPLARYWSRADTRGWDLVPRWPCHRHGAQNALLARRLQEAATQGAQVAVTETDERVPDKPDNSYRNILKAGFVEAYVRQNYLSI